ncbi:MAG: transglutaminase-like domain-containing protein [Bacteroidales bacterium]
MNANTIVLLVGSMLLCSCTSFYSWIGVSPSARMNGISFAETPTDPRFVFDYPDTCGNGYLDSLRATYALDQLIVEDSNDLQRIASVLDWTSQQWSHHGSNAPSKQDAWTILKEAREGKQFRCVEYGIVASAALNAVGLKARVLGLKTRDVERVMRGAGHVVAEVYSDEWGKWIFLDPQFNVLPVLDGLPLNAVEFQQALVEKNPSLTLVNKEGTLSQEEAARYTDWVGKYLYYFDALFDQRSLRDESYKRIEGMTKLTLVPVGSKEPRVFQRNSKINYSHYTHSLNDFYQKPD